MSTAGTSERPPIPADLLKRDHPMLMAELRAYYWARIATPTEVQPQ